MAVGKPLRFLAPAEDAPQARTENLRGGSHRCRTSKAKNMERTAPKQLEDAELKEEEGEDVQDNHRKGPMADRIDSIGAAFSEDAERRMGQAVEKTRNTFAKRNSKGKLLDYAQVIAALLVPLPEFGPWSNFGGLTGSNLLSGCACCILASLRRT